MAKDKKTEELSLEEAINAVKRLSKPDRPNKEFELLKSASTTLLNEVQPGFEFEEDDDAGGGVSKEELTKAPGFMEQIGAQAAALGPAGLIALGSAAYFQIDTVVEETRVVQQVAEEKWEEVKLEHPNINWDDPLAGFTTIIGMGDIEIDLDPPASSGSTGNTPSDDTTKGNLNANKSTAISEESGEGDEEGTQETDSKESDTDNEPVEDGKEEPVEEEAEEPEEQEEKPKKKKKGLFGLFGGDDDEAEEAEEESESEPEAKAEEKSNKPEPEAEEQVEEKPKKKKGFFSFLTGGGDDDEEPDSEEQGEPTQDGDTIPDEQTEKESTTESETETSEGKVDGGEQAGKPETNANIAKSNGIKKSSGGGLLSLFGINSNEKEVVEESEISTDEEPVIEIAETKSVSEAPPISEIVKGEAIEVAVEAEPEVNIADVLVNADVVIDDIEVAVSVEEIIQIDDVIEETVAEVVIDKVITPIEGTPGTVIVSPAGPANDIDFADIFGPNAPRYDMGESDATPI